MVMVHVDVATTCASSGVVVVNELLSARNATRALRDGVVVVMHVVTDEYLLEGVRLTTSSLILRHIVEVARLAVSAAVVSITRLDHVHQVNVGPA